jgi:hypothetical protein
LAVFSALLEADDARRVSDVVEKLTTSGFRDCALTGSLAIAAQLRAHGRPISPCRVNDVDLVVEHFDAIPAALADRFVLNHIHPHAPEGKTLMQLIARDCALRVDVFKAFGTTLSRARALDSEQTGLLPVLGVEDLVTRTTAQVCGRLRKGLEIDGKHVRAFTRLADLGRPTQLEEAWQSHREDVPGTLHQATREAYHLLARHPELVVSEEYSSVVTACDRCQDYGPFRLASPETVVAILGYW